jgi:hypothetical protein
MGCPAKSRITDSFGTIMEGGKELIGRRTVPEARMFYAATAEKFVNQQETSPYTQQILFPEQQLTNDPDIAYF